MNATQGPNQLSTRDGDEIRKGRVSPALQSAVVLIVEQGLTVAEAAQRTGYKRESLAKALLKPHVRALRADIKRAWLESETSRAWQTVVALAHGATSEKVKLEAARTILSAAGELAPVIADAGQKVGCLIQIIRSDDQPGMVTIKDGTGVFTLRDDEPFESRPAMPLREAN